MRGRRHVRVLRWHILGIGQAKGQDRVLRKLQPFLDDDAQMDALPSGFNALTQVA